MSIWFHGSIKVRAFTDEALNRVKKLDLEEKLRLPGYFSCYRNQLDFNESMNGVFDAENIVYMIKNALNGEGIVSATYSCEEDVENAFTYYDLGDGEKVVYFSGRYPEDVIYSHQAQHAALMSFDLEDLKEIYREVMEDEYDEEEAAYYKTREDFIAAIMDIFDMCVYEAGEGFFETPYLKKVLDQIIRNAKVCLFEDDDFEPNIGWEEKGYVKFTDIEKAYLNANTMEELKSALDRIKKTEKKTKTETQKELKEKNTSKMNDLSNREEEPTNGLKRNCVPPAAQKHGENVWHSIGDGNHEFRIYGFEGYGTPVYIDVREKDTEAVLSTERYEVDFGDYKPENGYGLETEYLVTDIVLQSDDQFRFNWYVWLLENGIDVMPLEIELIIDIYPAEEENEQTEDDYPDEAVNQRVREEFARQINEKKAELERLSLKEDKIREEIRLLEKMLEKI